MSQDSSRTLIRFGTDGWRAVIASDFTFANLERVAQAYATYIQGEYGTASPGDKLQLEQSQPSGIANRNSPFVIIGYDRRFFSERFALRVAEVLTGNEIEVAMFDRDVPTQLVSWAVREQGAAGGVMITASHNPPEFNGFKIKAAWGGSATPEITSAVEALVDAKPDASARVASLKDSGIITNHSNRLEASVASYRQQVESFVEIDRLRSLRAHVVVDPMHGTGGRWIESFLGGGRLGVETIRADRDPLFGGVNPEPIDQNLMPLRTRVRETKALVGLATDGDADRVGAVDDRGQTMTMHEVVPLVLLHLARNRKMTGGVVRTFSQSVLLKRIAAAFNLQLFDTPIGFKYIADLMLREKILIGAEESGGIGVQGHIPERDGLLNSLLFLEAIAWAGTSPSEMVKEMHREFGEFYFGRRDLHTEVERGQALVASLAASPPASVAGATVEGVAMMDGTKLLFDDESWLLFRQSGTEPMLRIYAEATSRDKVQMLLDQSRAFAQVTV